MLGIGRAVYGQKPWNTEWQQETSSRLVLIHAERPRLVAMVAVITRASDTSFVGGQTSASSQLSKSASECLN